MDQHYPKSLEELNTRFVELNRLSLLLESTLEGWWEWDVVANVTYHSPQWYRMLGYEKDKFPSSYNIWVDLMHPEDARGMPLLQNEKMANSESWELEFRMRCADGTYKWIRSRGSVVQRSPEGKAEKVVGLHTDLTVEKELESVRQMYKLQEELLNGIIRVSPVVFNVYDFVKKRILYSTRIGTILNYTSEQLEQISDHLIEELVHPEDLPKLDAHRQALKDSEQNQIVECLFRMKDSSGVYVWVKIADSVFARDHNGEITQLIGAVYNVNSLVEMEQKLEDNLKALENLAFENSHLVRGPVSSILGLMALIKKDHVQSDIDKQLIEYMERTVIKMDQVIRNFSDSIDQQIRNKKKGHGESGL